MAKEMIMAGKRSEQLWVVVSAENAEIIARAIKKGVESGKKDMALKRLAKQWPKKCGCGQTYTTPAEWTALPHAYHQTDTFATIEYRHCECGSTLGIILVIHDVTAE